MIQATLQLYLAAGRDTASSLARSAWGLLALLIANVLLMGAMVLLSPFGIAGGIVIGLVHAALAGWYLALLDIAVVQKRRVLPSDLPQQLGVYTSEVISVLFVFWIASLLLMSAPTALGAAVMFGASIAFNPAPEMIYQERSQGTGLLVEAASFISHNWPEWLGLHVLLVGLIVAALSPFADPTMALGASVAFAQVFGPWFDFVGFGPVMMMFGGDPAGFAVGLVFAAIAHVGLLFRGHLYARLRGSSRRARAWRARLE